MAARSGMTTLIDTVRGYTDAGTADYTVGTVTYWTDEEIQRALDRNRQDIYRSELSIVSTMNNGTVEYKQYYSDFVNLEETSGGTAIFTLENVAGTIIGTALYTPDYTRGQVTFGDDNAGSAVFLNGRSYDLNAAAVDIWKSKAANVSKLYDFSTDNHNLKRSQAMKQYLEMAKYYEGLQAPVVMSLYRGDMR